MDTDRNERPVEVRAYPDGPLIVRGPVIILDEFDRQVCPEREVIALCRCGRSRIAPVCDGSHRSARPRVRADLGAVAATPQPA
jgi:CDGSH-type Zn-finger protein